MLSYDSPWPSIQSKVIVRIRAVRHGNFCLFLWEKESISLSINFHINLNHENNDMIWYDERERERDFLTVDFWWWSCGSSVYMYSSQGSFFPVVPGNAWTRMIFWFSPTIPHSRATLRAVNMLSPRRRKSKS